MLNNLQNGVLPPIRSRNEAAEKAFAWWLVHRGRSLRLSTILCVLALTALSANAQIVQKSAASATSEQSDAIQELTGSIRGMRDQIRALNSQLNDLRTQEQRDRAEADELRKELNVSKTQANSPVGAAADPYAVPPGFSDSAAAGSAPTGSIEDRLAKLEEDQQLTDSKVTEQSQTKVESGSKYRVRLSGIVLLSMFDNRGNLDSQDVPEIATTTAPLGPLASPGSFGGSLRQSQIGIDAFGPGIFGARTSANLKFDFAGGFPSAPNGAGLGLVRLRTGTIRFDWTNTSVVAGQDYLFFAPLAPTSFASLALPSLSYAGNLWGWIPQVRIEHRIHVSDSSIVLLQAGILDSYSGDEPESSYDMVPSWGEESGQPAYAGRVSWSGRPWGQNVTVGTGAVFGRQSWGFGRNVDGWASTTDLTLPLGHLFEFSGQFYRGRAVAGLGGGLGQDIIFADPSLRPGSIVEGLDSMGGWVQLKFKPRNNFEVNGALGVDNPFAAELRRFPATASYEGYLLSKNLSPFVNFIYRPRSDVVFSVEYRRLKTFDLDHPAVTANHTTFNLGYLF
jgi:hypothetical protein